MAAIYLERTIRIYTTSFWVFGHTIVQVPASTAEIVAAAGDEKTQNQMYGVVDNKNTARGCTLGGQMIGNAQCLARIVKCTLISANETFQNA